MIYIIVPVFNRAKITLQFLELLSKQQFQEFKAVVVDDGSSDNTSDLIRAQYPETEIVTGDGNWWWTKSVNEGIRHALKYSDCTHVLMMNDDTFFEEDYLLKMWQAQKEVPGCIVGSLNLTFEKPHRVFFSGLKKFRMFTNKGCRYHEPLAIVDRSKLSGLYPSVALPGRGVLIPVEIVKKYGLYDQERLPQYGADFSYITKLYRKHQVKSYISWDAQVFGYTELTGEGSSFTGESLSTFLRSFIKPKSRQYLPDKWEICKVRHGYLLGIPAFFALIVRSLYGYFKRRNLVLSQS
jgi:GT2 family glycosyltransferase